MARFVRSVLSQDRSVTVSEVQTLDLPVNPLSHFLITLKALNDTGTITAFTLFNALINSIATVEVLFKGQAIVSGSLRDLAMLNWQLTGWLPWLGNTVKDNDAIRWITVPISMTRRPMWPMEAFPASRRGELQLRLTYAAAQTGVNTLVEQIETVELLDASPERFLKYTTLTKTPTSTGNHDVDLPIGNKILGVLLFSTTVPTGTSFNASIGKVKLLVDNVEFGYSEANWESLQGEVLNKSGAFSWLSHIHRLNVSASTELNTGELSETAILIQQYAYLDYDPLQDLEYAIETEGHSRVNLRIDQEPSADEIRVLPVEMIDVVGVQGG